MHVNFYTYGEYDFMFVKTTTEVLDWNDYYLPNNNLQLTTSFVIEGSIPSLGSKLESKKHYEK